MENKLYLSQKDIFEKEFKHRAGGYDPQDVDKFLDMINKDYGTLLNSIKDQKMEIEDLQDENAVLKQEIRYLNEHLEVKKIQEEQKVAPNNVDLLRRISNLEKVVFGKEE